MLLYTSCVLRAFNVFAADILQRSPRPPTWIWVRERESGGKGEETGVEGES